MKKLLFAAVLPAILVGCRTTQDVLNDYERNLVSGNNAALAPEPQELAEKGDGTRLLWHLLAGYGHHAACNGAAAIGQFDKAEDVFLENDQTSVFAQAGEGALAMMTNDRAFPYAGAGQDRIFTCFYKGVDYAVAGNRDAARTEFNRASQHQENWIYERRRDIDAAAERMKKDADAYAQKGASENQGAKQPADRDQSVNAVLGDASFAGLVKDKTGFDPAMSGNLDALAPKDYMNLYVHHACGVFRWLNGDGGREYLRDVSNILAANPVAVRDFKDADAGVKPQNQVWIYVEDGLCPKREEWRIDLPVVLLPWVGSYVMYAGMALPYLVERPAAANAWTVQANGTPVAMTPIADFDKLMRTEYDVYMRGALTREITRTVVKIGAQVALGVCANNTKDWKTQVALRASQIGVATWAASTTAADVRCWASLPKTALVCRIDRPADGKIALDSDGRRVQFDVPAGNAMVFVTKPSAAAAPSVRVVSFGN